MSGRPEHVLLSAAQVEDALAGLAGWREREGQLVAEFKFADFREAFAFMTRCAFEAEALEHHPDWTNVYNRVSVQLHSHDLGGISSGCVELARRMSRLARSHDA